MSPDVAFKICNGAVLPFWLLLAVLPRARVTALLVHSPVIPVVLGSAYSLGLLTLGPSPEGGGFSSLAGVMKLFTVPQAVLVGWIHYLVFDLFIGAWQVRDAARHRIPHLAVIPCLFMTLMAGPMGLLLYLALRAALRRRLSLVEDR